MRNGGRITIVILLLFAFFACNSGGIGSPCDEDEECNGNKDISRCCGCGIRCWQGTCQDVCADSECCYYGNCTEGCRISCNKHGDCGMYEQCINGGCEYFHPSCGWEPEPGCTRDLEIEECKIYKGVYWCPEEGDCFCSCPTYDGNCYCNEANQCETICYMGAFGIDCAEVTSGRCNLYNDFFYGCYCVMGEEGTFSEICVE